MLINTKSQIQEKSEELKYQRHGIKNNCGKYL